MSGYDTDLLEWSERQADLLRRLGAGEKVNNQVDWENIAEEIESLGQSERRSLAKYIRTVIEHLAKLEASPASEPRIGWRETIMRTRLDIQDLLKSSPSLRPTLDVVVSEQMPKGLNLAMAALALYGETPRIEMQQVNYTTDQITGDWFPGV
jgi:hypothetical protein